MKKALSVIINKCLKKDLELLYGEGTFIEFVEVKKCTTNKKYLINCKLMLKDLTHFKDLQEEGVHYLLEESWKFAGMDSEKMVVSLSYELI